MSMLTNTRPAAGGELLAALRAAGQQLEAAVAKPPITTPTPPGAGQAPTPTTTPTTLTEGQPHGAGDGGSVLDQMEAQLAAAVDARARLRQRQARQWLTEVSVPAEQELEASRNPDPLIARLDDLQAALDARDARDGRGR